MTVKYLEDEPIEEMVESTVGHCQSIVKQTGRAINHPFFYQQVIVPVVRNRIRRPIYGGVPYHDVEEHRQPPTSTTTTTVAISK